MQDLISVQKRAIVSSVGYYRQLGSKIWDCIGVPKANLKQLSTINILGSGSSLSASRIGQFFFESICRVPARFYRPSEFMHMPIFPQENSLYFFVSASGVSDNILAAIDYINSFNYNSVAITNSPTSFLVKETDGFLLTQLPQDTKFPCIQSFTPQLAALYWLAHRFAVEKGVRTASELEKAENDLIKVASQLEMLPKQYQAEIEDFIGKYALCKNFAFIGRNLSYPLALEASFQMKEYAPHIYSNAYPSGEFVRSPALQENKSTPIIMFSTPSEAIYSTLLDDAREIKAKNGHLISFAFEDQEELISLSNYAFKIPKVAPLLSPFVMSGLIQSIILNLGTMQPAPEHSLVASAG